MTEVLCNRRCAPGAPDRDCLIHGHLWEPSGPYVVTELSLSGLTAEQAQGEHPERTPVGPFDTRAAADKWAHDYIGRFGGSGSWSLAPIHPPR